MQGRKKTIREQRGGKVKLKADKTLQSRKKTKEKAGQVRENKGKRMKRKGRDGVTTKHYYTHCFKRNKTNLEPKEMNKYARC